MGKILDEGEDRDSQEAGRRRSAANLNSVFRDCVVEKVTFRKT